MKDITGLTVQSVVSYLENNSISASQLPTLIETFGQSWAMALNPEPIQAAPVAVQRKRRKSAVTTLETSHNANTDQESVSNNETSADLLKSEDEEYEERNKRPEPMFED